MTNKSTKLHTIVFRAGDSSGDGHEKHRDWTVCSNLSKGEINDAYLAAVKKLGFDPTDNFDEYEANRLPSDQAEKLIASGFVPKDRDEDGTVYFYPQALLHLFLFMVKLGNPEFEYEEVKASVIYIGGYGLFL
ncbi:MAG: hypothetical protein E6R04_05535 [Spirochaetes bacterium]|nr:MAG: hypothetical protein E6R04_05535 [Spirochaetota bacterium]